MKAKDLLFTNVERLMKERNIKSAKELARGLDINEGTVSNWFIRESIPIVSLDAIATYFNVEISELFTRDVEFDVSTIKDQVDYSDRESILKASEEIVKIRNAIGAGSEIKNFYVQPLGRTLPGINHHVVDALNVANITDSDNRAFYPLLFLIEQLFKEKSINANFKKMIDSLESETRIYFQRQTLKIAKQINGESDGIEEFIDKIARDKLTPNLYERYIHDGGARKFLEITIQNHETENLYINDWSVELSKFVSEYFGIDLKSRAREIYRIK